MTQTTALTVAVATLGCKTNQFESDAMMEQLLDAGYRMVPLDQGADLVLVNTCTVTAATDAQSRNLIRRVRRLNPRTQIVVTGCYAQISPDQLQSLPGVSLVIGNEEKTQLLNLLKNRGGDPTQAQVHVSDVRTARTTGILALKSFSRRSRAFVQIQNGCDAFCSYCIIPYARGASRSVPVEQVVRQIEDLSGSGYEEIVLTGIHIGGYGRDLLPQTDLLALLRTLEKTTFSGRLRLGSIEPTELPDELCEYIMGSDRICPHLHIPLQAGDDEILHRMNRHYDTAMFSSLLNKLLELNPDAAIGLDVICGFPGETDGHFESTLGLLELLPFTHLHVFPFSCRPGTPAAKMPDQVASTRVKQRAAQLRVLGEQKLLDYQRRFIGRELDVLIESGTRKGLSKGLSQNYLTVFVPDQRPSGRICRVKIASQTDGGLLAEKPIAVS